MKTHITIIFCLLAVCLSAEAKPKEGHYSQLDNKAGEELWNSIYTCTQKGYSDLTYDGLIEAYLKTDADEDGNIIDMYGGCQFPSSKKCGNYGKECDCYNREHSIPKSWWGGSPKTSKQGSDIFHLVPTDGYVNNMRGNLAFGEVKEGTSDYNYNQNKRGSSSLQGYSGTVFEPCDEYKGDFARGYMGTIAKWNLKATTGDGATTFTGEYTDEGNFGLTDYGIFLLMKWHRQDPVSEKELKRNDAIEQTQGNRNPFIDYPELAEYLWGSKRGQTVMLAQLHSAYDPDTVPIVETPVLYSPVDGSTVTFDSVCPGDTATLCLRAEGIFMPDVQLSIAGDDARIFSVSPTTLTSAQLSEGHDVCIIYTPSAKGAHTATLIISSAGLRNVEINILAQTRHCEDTMPDTLHNAVQDMYYEDYCLEIADNTLHFMSATQKDFLLYDLFGRTIIRERTTLLNTTLPQGIYIAYIDRKPHKILIK